jgi:hypothetical protein
MKKLKVSLLYFKICTITLYVLNIFKTVSTTRARARKWQCAAPSWSVLNSLFEHNLKKARKKCVMCAVINFLYHIHVL